MRVGGGRGALPYIHRKRCDTACVHSCQKNRAFSGDACVTIFRRTGAAGPRMGIFGEVVAVQRGLPPGFVAVLVVAVLVVAGVP